MAKFAVRTLDVWGNAEDGWDVNDVCTAGEIEIPDDATCDDIRTLLRKSGWVMGNLRNDAIGVDDTDGDLIFVSDDRRPRSSRKNPADHGHGMPVLHLVRIEPVRIEPEPAPLGWGEIEGGLEGGPERVSYKPSKSARRSAARARRCGFCVNTEGYTDGTVRVHVHPSPMDSIGVTRRVPRSAVGRTIRDLLRMARSRQEGSIAGQG